MDLINYRLDLNLSPFPQEATNGLAFWDGQFLGRFRYLAVKRYFTAPFNFQQETWGILGVMSQSRYSPGWTWKYLRGKPQFPGPESFHSGLWHFFQVNGVGKFSWFNCEKDCRRLIKTTIVFNTHIIFVLLCIVLTFQITV